VDKTRKYAHIYFSVILPVAFLHRLLERVNHRYPPTKKGDVIATPPFPDEIN
jgi:hypothetical protein